MAIRGDDRELPGDEAGHRMETVAEVHIRFEYDAVKDLYVVYPCGVLSTEAGCAHWYDQFAREFGSRGRKFDMIVVLDMFSLNPRLSEIFGRYREALHANFTRHTVRLNNGAHEINVAFSEVQRDTARDIPEAIALIERRRDGERRVSVT